MAETSAKNYKFKAEVSQLLDILTHSLYQHRDVFIRELISNAADALDKIRFKDVQGDTFADSDLPLKISITLDKEARTFTIADTGIGMTDEELKQNIGTIARSGTADFLKTLSQEKEGDLTLIGRFGVGFYSVFMAAEKVVVVSKSADPHAAAWRWTSDGKNSFKIEPAPSATKRGTAITAYLREDAEEFSEPLRVRTAIEKYSNFVPFPIELDGETVNTVSAIWREPKSRVKKKDYHEFYKFIAHQHEDPLTWMHFSADVPIQFHTLLFVPRSNFEHLGFGRDEEGINLFVKRVMIDPHAKEILPPYLRFVRGVLESDDLPLNISRETLQENPYLMKIRNTVVGKFLTHLAEFAEKQPDDYAVFWEQHGRILKEGYNDYSQKDKVAALFRFNSSASGDEKKLTSLDEYIERMPEKQEEILFLSGASRDALVNSPALEFFQSRKIEVLFCYDPIDEFVLPGLLEYKGKRITSADQTDLGKLKEAVPAESGKDEETGEIDIKGLEKLTRRMKNILGVRVEDVTLSDRLVSSPAMLTGRDKHMSSQMEKIMHMVNKDVTLSPKILEINKRHPFIADLLTIYEKDAKDPLLTKLVNSLFSSALLLDGTIDDPHTMAASIQELMIDTAGMYIENKK
ncbi:molecular chaperone HtpG [bacterium]|nr:molecular chaperone HtpG [bacterium]